jgi:hypothetical protein
MMATKSKQTEGQTKSSRSSADSHAPHANLDNRYGRIGISAVAAAVRCKDDTSKQPKPAKGSHAGHYESD